MLAFSSGCYRGESKSVDEIFSTALERFQSYNLLTVETKARAPLQAVEKNLIALAETEENKAIYDQIRGVIDSLRILIPGAGYTSRPALSEIVDQYFNILNNPKFENSNLTVQDHKIIKLLAARTFFILESELNSVAFKLFEREATAG
jgi:hypothetical protein